MITLREALTRAAGQLSAHPDLRTTAVPDATLLLMHLLAIDRAALIAHPERPLTRDQLAGLQRLVERRLRFEPIQYITATQEFFGLALRVTPAVLIPRPETEILVEAVLAGLPREVPLRIVDVGTGSGAIAIALAHALPDASFTAVDLSAEALEVARENARTHAVGERIQFLYSDLLAALSEELRFDVIVSNPPYIAAADAATLHAQVREHEPAQALFGGPDGLDVYRRLIPEALARLKPGGLLALEIGYGQRDSIAALLSDAAARRLESWAQIEFVPDLQGIPRVVLARREESDVP